MKNNKALFAISSLWLWHATRTLVVIEYYLEKWYEIDIISYWNALNFLKTELSWKKVNFIELIDYPNLERWKWLKMYYYLIIDLIKTKILINSEYKFVKTIEKNYCFIFSDWKYWVYSSQIPCFLLTHQLYFIMPKWLRIFSKILQLFNYKSFKKFTNIFIPDYEKINKSLAWKLSHPSWLKHINYTYIWILSSYYNLNVKKTKKIDYLFTITWYLLENKKSFVNKLIKYAKKLDWKKIFILWDTKNNYKKKLKNNITIYSWVTWEERKQFFKNAQVIISRAWYTTIMDIVELEKKSILFPTPNQTEQEYLAKFLSDKNIFSIWNEKSNFKKLIKKTTSLQKFNCDSKTIKSLEKINSVINKYI